MRRSWKPRRRHGHPRRAALKSHGACFGGEAYQNPRTTGKGNGHRIDALAQPHINSHVLSPAKATKARCPLGSKGCIKKQIQRHHTLEKTSCRVQREAKTHPVSAMCQEARTAGSGTPRDLGLGLRAQGFRIG